MLPDRERADAPLRWLDNARADLALARVSLPEGALYEHLCFHAQQAAEKALKAVLRANAVEYPFTHNVQLLIDLLPAGLSAPQTILAAADLTPYAVATRYPGEVEPVTAEERAEAVRVATIVVQWAESLLT
jgi:HEPN domain-containing protein